MKPPTHAHKERKTAAGHAEYNRRQNAIDRRKQADVREVAIPKCRNPRRRARCRLDFAKYCKTYHPDTFPLEWSTDHLLAIERIQSAILEGALYALALPRGSGKTSLCEAAICWALQYGHRLYVIVIASDQGAADMIVENVRSEWQHNELLHEDFPEVTAPIVALEGVSLRARGQLHKGKSTKMSWSNKLTVLPTIPRSKASGGILEGLGLTGRIRGQKRKTAGKDRRPDLVVLDDPQTDESANSPTQCDYRERLILGAVLGLAGPGKKIAAVMPCTVIRDGDLADRMLDTERRPDWRGHRSSMVLQWPKDGSKCAKLWTKYAEVRRQGMIDHQDGGKTGTEFYRENRKAMDADVKVSWSERFEKDELSAVQHAYNKLSDLGAVTFHSEYQNQPIADVPTVYDMDPYVIANRLSGLKVRECPAETVSIVAFIDVNPSRGLHWVVMSSAGTFAGHVVAYGCYPGKRRPLWTAKRNGGKTEKQAIHDGLAKLCADLAKLRLTQGGAAAAIDMCYIDCGYEMDTVFSFCKAWTRRRQTPAVMPSRAFAAKSYRQARSLGRPGEHWHRTKFEGKGRVISHDADYWRKMAQTAFLMEPGAPGSIALYGQEHEVHRDFANHICAEKLVEHMRGQTADFYRWTSKPGEWNDWLDCLVGCCVGLSQQGVQSVTNETRTDTAATDNDETATEKQETKRRERRNEKRRKRSGFVGRSSGRSRGARQGGFVSGRR